MNQEREPDLRQLGVPKELVHQSARTLRNAKASLSDYLSGIVDESPEGSPAAADQQWIKGSHHKTRASRRKLLNRGLWFRSLTLHNITDHVLAMEKTLVGEPVIIWAYLSLSRVIQEGSIRVSCMFDPNVPPEQRAAGIAAAWVGDVQNQLVAAREFSTEPQLLDEANKAWGEVERTLEIAKLDIVKDTKGKPIKVVLGDCVASCKFDLSGAARGRPAHLPSWYRIASAASHSTTWMVQQATGIDREGNIVLYPDTNTITSSVLATLGAFEDLTETLGHYHGQNPTAAVRTLKRRTKAVVDHQRNATRTMQADVDFLTP